MQIEQRGAKGWSAGGTVMSREWAGRKASRGDRLNGHCGVRKIRSMCRRRDVMCSRSNQQFWMLLISKLKMSKWLLDSATRRSLMALTRTVLVELGWQKLGGSASVEE